MRAEIPETLDKALLARYSARTGHLEYKLTFVRSGKSHIRNCECRFAGESYFVANYGDDDGDMGLPPDGTEVENAASPLLHLMDREKNENWIHMQGSTSAGINVANGPTEFDVRMVGVECLPFMHGVWNFRDILNEAFPEKSNWHTNQKGDTIEVVAERAFSDAEQVRYLKWTWMIDPSKDSAITSVSERSGESAGKSSQSGRADTEYCQIDGFWFPKRCKSWRIAAGGGRKLAEYELVSGSFNKKDQPQKLTPALLKIPAGATIGGSAVQGKLVWDGTRPIPRKQWFEYKKSLGRGNHKSESSSTPQERDKYRHPDWWYDDSGKMGIADPESNPDTWEAYVRRWCLKNNVDDKQRTEARSVLESSRNEARAILDKYALEIDKIQKQLKEGKLDAKKADEARAEGQRLLAPIAEIFSRLKSRLEPLLLQKQISAKQPTSAPAWTP